MFKKIENKIKEIALQIHNSSDNENIYEDAKYIYELAVIYKFLSKRKKDSQWELHSEKLNETLKKLEIELSKTHNKTIIGYETGLLEIIDNDGNILIAKDIINFNYTGSKKINDIVEFNNKIYISTSFAIIVYDIKKLQFGDTYFIGNQSSEVFINQIKVFENKIYAATENGIYVAETTNLNLIDSNNWAHYFSGNFTSIEVFNNEIYVANNRTLFKIQNNSLVNVKTYPQAIIDIKSSEGNLTISTLRSVFVYNKENVEVLNYTSISTNPYYFILNSAFYEDETLYLGTQEFGILKSSKSDLGNFTEIHPEGPISNAPFSIAVKDANIWVVYGGYSSSYSPGNGKFGISHFNSTNWVNIPYSKFNVKNLVNVTFDYSNSNKVYISSWGASSPTDITNTGGMLIIEDNAQAIGSNYTSKDGSKMKAGTIGHVASTSFFPSKNLGCYGDGGAIFTNDDDLAHTIRGIVNHGMYRRYYHDVVGVNSRLDSIQAVILNTKLPHLDSYNKARQNAARKYNAAFKGQENIITPVYKKTCDSICEECDCHVYHQYTLKVKDTDRDALAAHLNEQGIPCGVYYPVPLHSQKAYADERYNEEDFKVTNQLIKEVISLPMHTELDDEQIEFITSTLINFING